MRIRSSLPVTMAGINNRQMQSSRMSSLKGQPMGDTFSLSTPAFQGTSKVVGEVAEMRSRLRSTGVGEKTINAITDLLIGKVKNGFKAKARTNHVDITSDSDVEGGKTWFRFDVRTDKKTYNKEGNSGDGFVMDVRSHHDPIAIDATTTPEDAVEKLTAGVDGLIASHHEGRRVKYVG